MTERTQGKNPEKTAEDVMTVLRQLLSELHTTALPRIDLDSSLDRDLGLDSMARMELLRRLEKHFQLTLPLEVISEAETTRDLLNGILGAQAAPALQRLERIAAAEIPPAGGYPDDSQTLVEVVEWHLQQHPDRPQVRLEAEAGESRTLTCLELAQGARAVAAGLQSRGLQPGAPVALMLPTGIDYLFAFLGTLFAGGIPVPLYPPLRRDRIESHLNRQLGILANCGAVTLITMAAARPFARLLKGNLPALRELTTVAELSTAPQPYRRPPLLSGTTAFLQYTSGSTGNPKGVILSHANLLANIRALGRAVEVQPDDVIVSWLPLYHDMGLIGTWLTGLYFGIPVTLLSPLDFLSRPQRWLRAIDRYRGTLSAAPNFAYEMCLNKIPAEELAGLDLSSWRGAFNGAEPVSPRTVENFCARFSPYGFRRTAMIPVYGLAECTVGLAFPPMGREPVIDRISRDALTRFGRALPAAEGEEHPLCLVACGRPLDGHELRIVDASGREVTERQEGRVQFRGPSSSSGYYRNPEENRKLFDGDWLNTGDLGYLAGNDLFLTGRSKDLIIVGGRNIYPQELEEAIGALPGIRQGNVVVFGALDVPSGSEKLVIVAETREIETTRRQGLEEEIRKLAVDLLETPPADLILAPPHTILKTSSGKLRRSACRALYEQGRLGKGTALWQQYLRLAITTLASTARRSVAAATGALYAGYLWTIFALAVAAATAVILLLPCPDWNWRPLRAVARTLRRLSGLPLRIEGTEALPPGPCVLVANHASYLDAFVLAAALPLRLRFVAKTELQEGRILGFLLRRIGTEFVARFDRQRGVEDARRIGANARRGGSLLFFAEGTFTDRPGLQAFRLGAFVIAAAEQLPLVPIALRGTRSVLPGDVWRPGYAPISVHIGTPLRRKEAAEDLWGEALELRRAARRFILLHCGEADGLRGGSGGDDSEVPDDASSS